MNVTGVLIGVDVGGTKVSVGTLGGEPKIEHTDKSAVVEQIVRQVKAAAADAGQPLAAVGVGIPSVVEWATGRVRSSVNIPLQDVPLRRVLEDQLGCPVYVDNDATVAALAEAHDKQGRLDVRHLVMLTVGTGIGGGIVIDGRPFRGATGAAGELGHTLIAADPDPPLRGTGSPSRGAGALREHDPPARQADPLLAALSGAHPVSEHTAMGAPQWAHPRGRTPKGAGGQAGRQAASLPTARFPQPGSLEALAAGHVLDALAARAAADQPGSALGQIEHPSGVDCVLAAHDGDQAAIEAIAILGRRLGIGIANAINTFDPDVVAIGGGVSAAGELLLGPACESAAGYVLPGVGTRTEIRIARSGPQAGVRGAALLARGELHEERTA